MAVEEREATIACVPDAIPPGEHEGHFALARRLLREESLERRRLPDGWALRFPPEALEAIARYVGNERRCCPFLAFTVEVAAGSGEVWLRMTGPEGTGDFLDTQLGETTNHGEA